MKHVLLGIVLILAGELTLQAQDAKVIILSAADAAAAKAAHETLKAAEKHWITIKTQIEKKYISVSASDFVCASTGTLTQKIVPCPKIGWESGIRFSQDFLAIVPTTDPGVLTGTINAGTLEIPGCSGSLTPAIFPTCTGTDCSFSNWRKP